MIPWLWRQLEHRTKPSGALRGPSRGRFRDSSAADVFHDAAARFLDVQISTDAVLDNKAFNTFSIGSTILPLTFGLLNLGPADLSKWVAALFSAALFAYVVLLAFAWRASRIRALEFRPDLPTLQQYSLHYTGEELRRWVALEYLASTEVNQPNLVRKARLIGAATLAPFAEGLLLSGAAVVALWLR